MNKSTKGALAAACGGVLLLGWAGSLAYWTDGTNIDGDSFASGHLQLTERHLRHHRVEARRRRELRFAADRAR